MAILLMLPKEEGGVRIHYESNGYVKFLSRQLAGVVFLIGKRLSK